MFESTELDSLLRSANQLVGQKKQLSLDLVEKTKAVSFSKGRFLLKDEMNDVLSNLQENIHRRAVGKFEDCLTGMFRDIFPGEDKIVIDVGIERQQTSISISATNDGQLEDVLDGRGGAITNILSVGLRFIALKRTKLRPFIVLDEADCWLKPDRVPAFAKVIYQLSKELGIQVLMISHHESDLFREFCDLVYLQKVDNYVSATSLPEDMWEDDQQGLRSLRLKNVQSHKDTLINLSPYVTAIIGDNDLGKSAITTALRALFHGEGKESIIRHHEEEASLEIDLGAEGVLSWSRNRKSSKNTLYSLTSRGRPIYETNGSKVPEWMADLGFNMPHSLDIQVGHQKKPVFLLNESGAKQAIVLSIGRESTYLGEMQEIYKKVLKFDTDTIKNGESQITIINDKLAALGDIDTCNQNIIKLQDEFKLILQESRFIEEIERDCKKIHALELISKRDLKIPNMDEHDALLDIDNLVALQSKMGQSEKLRRVKSIGFNVDTPVIEEVTEIEALSHRIKGLALSSGLSSIHTSVETPVLNEIEDLDRLSIYLSKIERINKINEIIHSVDEIKIEPIDGLIELCANLVEKEKDRDLHIIEMGKIQVLLDKTKQDMDDITESFGGECPLCQGVMMDDNHNHQRI